MVPFGNGRSSLRSDLPTRARRLGSSRADPGHGVKSHQLMDCDPPTPLYSGLAVSGSSWASWDQRDNTTD